jgi:hypothetical protein
VAVIAAVAILIARALPPPRLALAPAPSDGTVAGAMHVHTDRSDGRGTIDEIAAAASRAGLAFIVFTDHGDATRAPDPPSYRSGVLCLDGVEISTNGGHYIALDMPASPYPLGGDARDVVDDVRRFGGFGIVAHPDSPNPSLRWSEWEAPFDAIEVMNLDTSWRIHMGGEGWLPRWHLFSRFLTYPFRPGESIASLLTSPGELLQRYDAMTAARHVVAVAGVDAHGQIGLGDIEPGDGRLAFPIPSYAASFRALSVHVRTEAPLTGDPAADATAVMQALRRGHVYVSTTGFASPSSLEVAIERGPAGEGATTDASSLRVRSNRPEGFETIVFRNGQVVATREERQFALVMPPPEAPYRVEVRRRGSAGAPWLVSNPVGGPASNAVPASSPAPAIEERRSLFDGKTSAGWSTETDPTSLAALDVPATTAGRELRLRFGLSGGALRHQFAALVADLPGGLGTFDRVVFSIRAEQPMRISVQARAPGAGEPHDRWQRSVYVDTVESERTVVFADMRPVGEAPAAVPQAENVTSLVFAVEMTNTKPGASGRVWITRAELQRTSPATFAP